MSDRGVRERPGMTALAAALVLVATLGVSLQTAIEKQPANYRVVLQAASDVLSGNNPYAAHSGLDYFKYSPLAGLLAAPLLALPETAGLFLFVLLQALLLYWAFWRWSRSAGYAIERSAPLLLVAVVSVLPDLMTSLQNAQVNAVILALMMLGAAGYAESSFVRSGLVLSLASNLKLFPLLFAACLLTGGRIRFAAAFFLGLLLWFLLPSIALGLDRNLELHRRWLDLMTWDQGRQLSMLDLGDLFELYFGVDEAVRNPWALAVGSGIGVAAWSLFRRNEDALLHRFLLPANGLYVLLFSYLSESPTSVLAVPGIFLLGAAAAAREPRARALWIAWIAALVLVPSFYVDLLPVELRAWGREAHLKTLGYLFVFCANLYLFFRLWRANRVPPVGAVPA